MTTYCTFDTRHPIITPYGRITLTTDTSIFFGGKPRVSLNRLPDSSVWVAIGRTGEEGDPPERLHCDGRDHLSFDEALFAVDFYIETGETEFSRDDVVRTFADCYETPDRFVRQALSHISPSAQFFNAEARRDLASAYLAREIASMDGAVPVEIRMHWLRYGLTAIRNAIR